MVFPALHKYLSFSGTLRTLETWSFGLRVSYDGFDGDQAAEEAALEAFAGTLGTWWGTQALMGSEARLTTLKFNAIGADGKYVHDYTVRYDYPTTGVATSLTGKYPNQIALVATLETGRSRGYAHRGRIFLPNPTYSLDPDGRISAANAQSAANATAALINMVNNAPQWGRVGVYSQVGAGTTSEVTGVTVGRVLDTMRSRRTSLDEGRMPAAVAAGT